ncbi:zinc-binding dehydrogenase [Mucisphaera calidilacus]|uniref:Phthiocerol synthesis polyketide synthase type I PpsC n=1 Tax=Mucisphaera calidilacus TaxID=2527982 RepID=A0A518BZ08_9BACT|nr:zinc-binding dehydrogenase [Mucisphaera calidilacus]QDU72208.1 Phthiocerol synthesis polyketide synthase type I PpsC [Mucisphaera calidilacus]
MQIVIVKEFGGIDRLEVEQQPTPTPGPGQVLVRLTSIGMNHAELMGRRGEYKISTGEPPFTPGLEGGGVIESVGDSVHNLTAGQRVVIGPSAPRPGGDGFGGTYRSHYLVDAQLVYPAPDAIPDDQLGTLWLPYLTAWGCLIWQQNIQPGQTVALPAASSSVALAAAQIARAAGAIPYGLTRSPAKAERIRALDTAVFEDLIITHEDDGTMRKWHRDFKQITDGRGIDVFFDPVASGDYLDTEIRALANDGCVWVYGLLGPKGPVDVTPLIRKRAAIRGWGMSTLVAAGPAEVQAGCDAVLRGFESGAYRQEVGGKFPLSDVRHAHTTMERGEHLGKLVLVPDGE